MLIGTYYYPEQWPRDQWERDFDNMTAMGMRLTHLGEFAWLTMEPEPGRFEFGWIEECMGLAAERGMGTILCTPTAAPPVWLTRDHPEILPVDAGGRRARHGGRRHYNPLQPALHKATTRIVAAMAEKFGDHPAVVGWQIDNEFGSGFGSGGEGFDQSDVTHTTFQQWLRRKFDDNIAKLNRAWGNEFWNTDYSDFNEILMPAGRDPGYANPHHHLDASRFWSTAFADYCKLQADILRPRIGDRFITHNFMPFHPDTDPGDFTDSLSLYGWDTYPLTGWGGPFEGEDYRLADPRAMEFVHDQMASYTGRWGLLEVQPGQTNWSGFPVRPLPGAVRLWVWTALAHGAEFVTVYRYRQPRVGQEQHHDGLTDHDGVTLTPGGEDFKQVAAEVRAIQERTGDFDQYKPLSPIESPRVGLLFDFDGVWLPLSQKQAKAWDYPAMMTAWHAAFASRGVHCDVLHPSRPWPDDLKVIAVPGLQTASDALVKRLREFAEGGGQLIMTCRSLCKDEHGRFPEGPTCGRVLDLIGGRIDGYDVMPAGMSGTVEMGGETFEWNVWAEQLVAGSAEVWATHADQFYKGTAAVLHNTLPGGGGVTYHGVADGGDLAKVTAGRVMELAGIPSLDLADRTRLYRRGGLSVFLNYNATPTTAPAGDSAEFLVGSRDVPAAGVAVWR